ncbi:hypothetical protein [Actinoplanes sp. NPDC020271]|uniref:hypothetical protein n=1 Tax=Actinoplanes sp. NPDC020271 TaxID=3363896 RepID=UPI0037882BDA
MLVRGPVFAVGVRSAGVPAGDPPIAFGWLWPATVAWRNDQPWRTQLRFLGDWPAIVTIVYVSHFPTVPAIAVILWVRARAPWARFMRRWLTLRVLGLVTYFLCPAAPPATVAAAAGGPAGDDVPAGPHRGARCERRAGRPGLCGRHVPAGGPGRGGAGG